MMPGKAVLYLRVSTGQQVDRGSSLPSQESACREYAERNGYEVVDVYVDEGESARTADRDSFQEMIYRAKQPDCPFSAIICYENSRFARSREDAILYKALLRKKGIELIFTKQDFDDTPAGRLLEGIIEVVDEWYSNNLAVETVRGQKQTAAQGYSCGGRPPYGLRRVETKNEFGKTKARWEPDPDTAPIVRRIYTEFASGKGQKAIAYSLNAEGIPAPRGNFWTNNSLHYILFKNYHAYLGNLVFNREDNSRPGHKYKPEDQWVVLKGAWEPIVEEAVVDDVLGRRRTHFYPKRDSDPDPFILSGLVYCGLCGARMNGTSIGRKQWRYYRCQRNSSGGKSACPQRGIPKKDLENEVVKSVKKVFLSERTLKGLVSIANSRISSEKSEMSAEVKRLEKERSSLLLKKTRLLSAIEDGVLERGDVKERMMSINDSILRVDRELDDARGRDEWVPFTHDDCVSWMDTISSVFEKGSLEVIQKQLHDIIERVIVSGNRIEILYRKGNFFA